MLNGFHVPTDPSLLLPNHTPNHTPNTPSSVFMPPIDKTKITEQSSIDLIDWELGTQVTHEAITDYRSKQIKRNARLRGGLAAHPKREAIYTALKSGLKNPTQVCACGCPPGVTSTTSSCLST